MTNILITGGAGYLGTTLVDTLMRGAKEIASSLPYLEFSKLTVYDNLMYRQAPLLNYCSDNRFNFVKGDVRNEEDLAKVVRDADIIIPLAAVVGFPACEQDKTSAYDINVGHIKTIIKHKKSGAKIIYPNTNSGYGVGDRDEYCTEETPLNPVSYYGVTKCMAEEMVLDEGGVSLRLATVFGISPRMRMDLLVNDFVYKAYKDKYIVLFEHNFRRNYIHVKDVATAFIKGIKNYEVMGGEAYNVGLSDANLTKLELAKAIEKYTPLSIQIDDIKEDPDKRDYLVSNDKIESLGWKPMFGLDDGIKELLKGYPIVDSFFHPYCNI